MTCTHPGCRDGMIPDLAGWIACPGCRWPDYELALEVLRVSDIVEETA